MVIANITQFFLLSIALGMGLFSLLANTKMTGVGFYKVVLGLVGGSTLLSGIIHGVMTSVTDMTAIAHYITLAIVGTLYLFHRDDRSPLMWGLYLAKVIAVTYVGYLSMGSLNSFYFWLSSTAILGIVTYAMVLGHWYLVTPKLTEKPLAVAMVILWGVMLFKVPHTAYQYFTHETFFEAGTQLGMGYVYNWIMLIMRVVWGYVIIGIMSYFSWRLIRMRSLQSATGVLYVMTFFVFIGELISSFLFYEYGIAL